MPFGACDTGVWRTTSAGGRVMAGAACDMVSILAHRPTEPARSGAIGTAALQSQGHVSGHRACQASLVVDSGARAAGNFLVDSAFLRRKSAAGNPGYRDWSQAARHACEYGDCVPA